MRSPRFCSLLRPLLLVTALFLLLLPAVGTAQRPAAETGGRWSLRPGVGYTVGALVPTPLPAELRSIAHYSPVGGLRFGADAVCHTGGRVDLSLGAYFTDRGMDSEVRVAGYRTRVVRGAQQLSGYFFGTNATRARLRGLFVPLALRYPLGRCTLTGGAYLEWYSLRQFSGTASDGYLRVERPTGDKVLFGPKNDGSASYDFSDALNDSGFGVHLGAEYALSPRFLLNAQLTWGLTPAFDGSFTAVPTPFHAGRELRDRRRALTATVPLGLSHSPHTLAHTALRLPAGHPFRRSRPPTRRDLRFCFARNSALID